MSLSLPLLLALLASPLAAGTPTRIEVDAALIAGLERQPVSATLHGNTVACTGVLLADVLRSKGVMPDKPLHGASLARTIRAIGRDGYRVAFSLAELDASLGATRAYVVDACNGKALDPDDGPIRLIVPDVPRGARSVRQLQAIEVIDAP